jgi:hypothetical protein
MYRQFRLMKLTAQFIPSNPNTAGGQLAIGIDSDVFAGSPSSYGNVIRHRASAFMPIFQEGSFVWTPSNSRDREDKNSLATTHTEDTLSQGVLQIYSTNTLANNAPLGTLWLQATICFSMPS